MSNVSHYHYQAMPSILGQLAGSSLVTTSVQTTTTEEPNATGDIQQIKIKMKSDKMKLHRDAHHHEDAELQESAYTCLL